MTEEEKRIQQKQEWLKSLSEKDRAFISRYGEDKWRKFKEIQETLQKPSADLKERLSMLIDVGSETAGDLVKQYENLVATVNEIDSMRADIAEELARLVKINDDMEAWLEAVKTAYKQEGLEVLVEPNLADPKNPKYYLHKKK
jgi:hypothetical protein